MKATVKQITIMACDRCDEEVYFCDGCNNYFEPKDVIFCQLSSNSPLQKNKHYCSVCAKEDLE